MADRTVIKADDLLITGNLKVDGTSNLQSIINTTSTDLTVKDRLITLNSGGTLGSDTAGIEIESGGSTEATLGYTAAAGWDFGNKNITTTGTISGTLSLATNSVNDTHIDFGTGANQVNTDDLPEGSTNQYFTNARADARIAAADTDALSEGTTNLYYTDARVDTRFGTKTTSDLTEGTNLYYTNARADARITNAGSANWNTAYGWGDHSVAGYLTDLTGSNLTTLQDVAAVGGAGDDGKNLTYNHSTTSFTWTSPAVTVANYSIDKVATKTLTSIGTTYGSSGVIATKNLTGINSGTLSKIQITFTIDIDTVTPSNTPNKFAIFKTVDGIGTTTFNQDFSWDGSSGNKSGKIYQGETTGYGSNVFTFTIGDDTHMGSTGAVRYEAVYASQSGTSTIVLNDIDFSATEFRTTLIDTLEELSNVTITSQQAGQILKASSPTNWVNETPTISLNSDVAVTSPITGHVLRYNGTQFVNTDMSPFSVGDFGDVDTTGKATGNILRYDGTNWVDSDLSPFSINDFGDVSISGTPSNGAVLKYSVANSRWEVGTDVDTGITDVVQDTTPQLGGNMDVQTHSIISTGSNNIILDPQGTGVVQILGDLTVTGTATTLDVTNVTVEDPIMLLNKHGTQPANNTTDSGIMVQRGSSENNAAWFWDEGTDRWKAVETNSDATVTDIVETSFVDIQAGTAHVTATQAQYADLAEIYESDAEYELGTVLIIGGEKEVTQCKMLQDPRVVGVVSTNPAYLMNKDANGVAVALRGKVPCKVEGPVRKGDVLVTNVTPGTATTLTNDSPTPPGFCVIGKSLETDETTGIKLINIIV
tara:strand:- start:1285 stop:3744 length:2460 start_codon:yes stop_codon:yes gene_type:complete